ncbi:hypothetical protein AX15_005744 [Amanita polypyramis BW_CC]|nr:hypothetical protein AX15_005744 [Amanita polypyramis BW_CC]
MARVDRNSPLYPGFPITHGKPSNMYTTSFIGAVEDLWEMYSDNPADYTIGEPIGFGSSSIVYSAVYIPRPSGRPVPCALKVLDLDSLPPRSLQLLQRETRLMSLSKHPNVLRVRGSWINGHKLYIAIRLMNKGSAADVMRYGWPGGMEEEVCRCILFQALQGLNYLHINGFIHRDVKAANLLIDDDGTVLLGDLGVAADLSEDTSNYISSCHSYKTYTVTAKAALSLVPPQANPMGPSRSTSSNKRTPHATHSSKPRIGKRKSFVGTPCWMAPELIQGKQYDSAADIWSFGITAIELTKGRPPRSRDPAKTVLLRTVQEDPPTIDREGGPFKYSRAFKEIVDRCLAKDPSKRPSAEELLQMPFFKGTKKKSYLVGAILRDLPPLTQRLERVIKHSTVIHRTIDSWDFATTISSPGSSIRRHLAFGLTLDSDEEDTNSVFSPYDSDDEFEEDYGGAKADEAPDSDDYVLSAPSSKRTEAIPIPFPSARPTLKVTGTSSSSSQGEDTPSSVSDSPLRTPKSQVVTAAEILHPEEVVMAPVLPPLMYGPPPESMYPLMLGTDAKPKPHRSNKPIKAPVTPSPPHSPSRRPVTASGPLGSYGFQNRRQSQPLTNPSSQGIWQKIRTNVRRPSFRGGAVELPCQPPSSFASKAINMFGTSGNKTDILNASPPSHEAVQQDSEVPERKGQSSAGHYVNKGRHAVNRKSSWTFQAVAFKQSNRT